MDASRWDDRSNAPESIVNGEKEAGNVIDYRPSDGV
jgi:hypothetical protein